MNNNRFSDNMLSNNKNTKKFIHKEHIISEITEFLINIESLGKKINSAFMMTLVTKPFNNTLIHRFEVPIIPNKRNFINKDTRFFWEIHTKNLTRIGNIMSTGDIFSSKNRPIFTRILYS